MVFKDNDEVVKYVKDNQEVSELIKAARRYNTRLLALIDGKGFKETLILFEGLETEKRKRVRRNFSRPVNDTFERLFQPIANVFHSTGESFNVDISSNKEKELFLKKLSNVRDEKTLKQYVESDWMPLYHIDPNGIIFTEYSTKDEEVDAYPTYKSIYSIRAYQPNGQLLSVVMFEPVDRVFEGEEVKEWRVVDDDKDYIVIQRKEDYTVLDEESNDHPFGIVPALLNSNIIDVSSELRLSPVDKILDLMMEFAVTQSNKSIYKIVQGNPKHWEVGPECTTCRGRAKVVDSAGDSIKCKDCNGVGHHVSQDVTDLKVIPYPREGTPGILPHVAGHTSPDLDTLKYFTEELTYAEKLAYQTLWGVGQEPLAYETATGRILDQQPKINRLNKYANAAEWVNWRLAEFMARVYTTEKETVVRILFGRRYILETSDALLRSYETAKKAGDSSTILDALLNEYTTSKHSNDMEMLRIMLIKISAEPYVHMTIEEVNDVFGNIEAQRKALFNDFFNTLENKDISEATIDDKYDKWFKENKKELEIKKIE